MADLGDQNQQPEEEQLQRRPLSPDSSESEGLVAAGDDRLSPPILDFRFDSDLLRVVEAARRALLNFNKQLEPALDVFQQVSDLAAPAIHGYNKLHRTVEVSIATALRPAFDSASLAATLLHSIDWAALLETMRSALPPNWDGEVDLSVIERILNDEGIPLVFVPDNSVLNQLLIAPDRSARVAILLGAKDQVLADCQGVLMQVTHSSLAGQLPLARDAVGACQDGHPNSGQALAVSVTETIVSNILGIGYGQAKQRLTLDMDDLAYTDVRVKAALAPIPKFYTAWYPNQGLPAPVELSRHVSVHQADIGHFTDENALIAAMLVTSVLKAVDESQHKAHPEASS